MQYLSSIKKSIAGVYYGWWVLAASWLLLAIGGGVIIYGFTTFFNPIAQEFNWSATQVSIAFSLRSVESGLIAPLIGMLIDRIGIRKVVVFGIVLCGSSLIMMSRIDSLLSFYGIFLLMSIGFSFGLGMVQYAAIAEWFSEKRTRTMGIVSTGVAFSGFSGPIFVWLINQHGWRDSLEIFGITMLVIGIPLGLIIKNRPKLQEYPGNIGKANINTTDDELPAISNTKTIPKKSDPISDLGVRQILKSRPFLLLFVFSFFTGLAQSSISVHQMPYLTNIGISREIAGWAILGVTGFSVFGRLGLTWAADKQDKRYLLALGAMLQFIGVLIFAMISNPLMIIPFILFYSPGFAGRIPLTPAIQVDYFGLKNFATIQGFLALGWIASSLISPVLAGWVIDEWGSYRPIWFVYAALTALAIPFVLSINRRK